MVPLQLGLTGGIGSGKSTVASMLVGLGMRLVDTDAISRSLTAPGGAGVPALAAAFGPDVIGADGALDRGRMRTLAFGDPASRRRLEAVLHPLIAAEALRQAQAAAGSPVVFDVPLLAEASHWRARVDRVLVVDCREETQIARVMARSGWSLETVRAVIGQQTGRAARRAIADAVIFNDGLSLPDLEAEVAAVCRHWTSHPGSV